MRHLGLFEGIGGFSLAARWMGWETKAWVEINSFSQSILKKHFPDAEGHGDIHTFDGTRWKGEIDLITGGFPCQPFSVAGKREGTNDERYLWDEMFRIIREVKPAFVVGENVYGLVSMEDGGTLEKICIDLESEGYKVQPIIIPACSVGAWHKRDRVWIIAYTESQYSYDPELKSTEHSEQPKQEFRNCNIGLLAHTFNGTNSTDERTEGKEKKVSGKYREKRQPREPNRTDNALYSPDRSERTKGRIERQIPELYGLQRCESGRIYANIEGRPDLSTPVLCGGNDGVSDRVDRVKALGNAIVPQVAFEIFKIIEQFK